MIVDSYGMGLVMGLGISYGVGGFYGMDFFIDYGVGVGIMFIIGYGMGGMNVLGFNVVLDVRYNFGLSYGDIIGNG